jgi:hypothetical protein
VKLWKKIRSVDSRIKGWLKIKEVNDDVLGLGFRLGQ